MALKATIFKAELQIADMDRHYYQTHNLTTARHPSETDERMMMRFLAFALNAFDELQFTRGLSSDDEPDLWAKNLIDHPILWIEVGLPDERRIRKGCNQSDEMIIYAYGDNAAPIWREQNKAVINRFSNLKIIFVDEQTVAAMAEHVQRTMELQFTLQEGSVMMSSDAGVVEFVPELWKA